MRRRGHRTTALDVFYFLAALGLLVGGSLWLDRRGVVVTARVEGKHERIVVGREPTGGWDRYYDVSAGFRLPDGTPAQAGVSVPRARYDALRMGDPIAVRYLPQLPFLARTADRTTGSVAWELARRAARSPVIVWVLGGILALWIASKIGAPLVLVTGVAWTAAAFPLLFPAKAPGVARGEAAAARVSDITTISKAPSYSGGRRRHGPGRTNTWRRLAVPYQVVQLAVPRPGGDTVLAVDAVDSGSVAGLAFGAVLPVRVDPSAPREAKLAAGTRRFVQRNRYHFLVPAIGAGILGTLAALGVGRRRRASRRPAASPAPLHHPSAMTPAPRRMEAP